MLAIICIQCYKEEKALAFDGEVITREGTDVSGYKNSDGDIDWAKVKASGIEFVMLRCGYRGPHDDELCEDSFFEENMKGALGVGLDVGVYYVSQAINEQEAVEEADYAIEKVKSVLLQNEAYDLTLPIVIDLESSPANDTFRMDLFQLSKEQRTKIVNAFCGEVEAQGYTAMYYANKNYLNNYLLADALISQYPLWYANYSNVINDTATIFQYSASGSIDGITGDADLDVQYIRIPDQVQNLEATMNNEAQISLTWTKVAGVYGYKIYRKSNVDNTEVLLETVKGAGKCTYNDTNVQGGVVYTYRVCGFLKTNLQDYDGNSSEVSNQHIITFDSQGGSAVGSTDAIYNSYITAPTPPSKKGYTFIGWYKESIYKTKWNFSKDKITKNITLYAKWAKNPTAPSKISVTKASSKSSKITWSSVSGATKYEIYRATSKTGTYKLVATTTSTNYKNTGLTKGKTYYYKVRLYKLVDGVKVYSTYSKILSIKM